METYFSNKKSFHLIKKYYIHLSIIFIVSGIISGTATYLVTPLYKSSAIVYPVNLPTFSEETNTEQMLQLLRSGEIRDSVIACFNLYAHYQIDPTSKHARSDIINEFGNNVSFSRTEYDAVEIEVYDKKPPLACILVDSIIKFYNYKVRDLHRQKHKEVLLLKKAEMEKKQHEIDSLQNKIREILRESNIKAAGIENVNMLIDGGLKVYSKLSGEGNELQHLQFQLVKAQEHYHGAKALYEKTLQEVEKDISYAQVVSPPFPADKKAYPIRWLITALGAFSALFLAVIILAILESIKKKE